MKTYTALYALDVPHYGTARIKARSDEQAITQARALWERVSRGEVTNPATHPEWEWTSQHRIVEIYDADARTIASNIALDPEQTDGGRS